MTRRERRIKHRRVRRVLASVTALGTVGLGIGMAGPAAATKTSTDDSCNINDREFYTTFSRSFEVSQGNAQGHTETHLCDEEAGQG
jgi:hypothetical protein